MAITATNLTANSSSTAGTSFSTASISPTTGRLILCAVASRRADSIQPLSPTVSGCGLTWVQVIGLDYDTSVATLKRLTVYRAMGTASTGAVTFDFGANSQTTCEWVIDEFAGTDTSGTNGSGAIVQSASQAYQPVSADPFTVTLAAFASANNGTYGVSTSDRGVVQSVGSGFTQVGSSGVSGVGAMSTMSEFVSTNQTTVAFNAGGTGNNAGIIGIELSAAASIVLTGSLGQFDPEMRILGWF